MSRLVRFASVLAVFIPVVVAGPAGAGDDQARFGSRPGSTPASFEITVDPISGRVEATASDAEIEGILADVSGYFVLPPFPVGFRCEDCGTGCNPLGDTRVINVDFLMNDTPSPGCGVTGLGLANVALGGSATGYTQTLLDPDPFCDGDPAEFDIVVDLVGCQQFSIRFDLDGTVGPVCEWPATGFEAPTYAGDSIGVPLNGQDLFYQPVPGSDSFLVFTYAGNALSLPVNPTGGEQFIGGTGPGGGIFARSQRDLTYCTGTGVWTVSFDIAATFTGAPPAAQNLGSFSSQLFPNEATFISLARWSDPSLADEWNADYVWFDAAGSQLTEQVADPGFQNLQVNHWYRWSTTFDLDTNLITEVAITDMTTGVTATNNPVDRYLWGGAGGAPPPSGLRFFAGSSDPFGNTLAFDNVSIQFWPAVVP